jgi:hypothetical protein
MGPILYTCYGGEAPILPDSRNCGRNCLVFVNSGGDLVLARVWSGVGHTIGGLAPPPRRDVEPWVGWGQSYVVQGGASALEFCRSNVALVAFSFLKARRPALGGVGSICGVLG